MENMTLTERQSRWKSLIDEQEQSGLTQEAFCKQHSINHATFTHYRGIFRRKKSPALHAEKANFAKINLTKAASSSEIKLILPNGFHCVFPIDINPNRIKEIMGIILSC